MRVQLQFVMCSDDGHEEIVTASGPVINLAVRLGGRSHLARLGRERLKNIAKAVEIYHLLRPSVGS